MVKALLHHIVGTISVICYFVNTVVWSTPIFILAIFKSYHYGAIHFLFTRRMRDCVDRR